MTTDWNGAASDYGIVGFRQLRDIHNILTGFYDVYNDYLPTPLAQDSAGAMMPENRANSGEGYGPALRDIPFMLRTPAASEAERGHQPEEQARARANQVTLSGQFMQQTEDIHMMPTPNTQEGSGKCRDWGGDLTHAITCDCKDSGILQPTVEMMPTPTTMNDRFRDLNHQVATRQSLGLDIVVRQDSNLFGRFSPAVERWTQVTGLKSPPPTEPSGKDGAERLSSKFTEWMMGLQPGWVTGVGLSRRDELKACGNGVVPQQAKLALKVLKLRFQHAEKLEPEDGTNDE